MKIEQIRVANIMKPKECRAYCISHVYINGKYSHDIIEDYDRGLDSSMSLEDIKAIKVYAKTAIPTGTYTVRLDIQSPTFKKKEYYYNLCRGYLPRLMNVKGYDGILMHCGIDENSSAGCLIVGENKVVGKVINSKAVFERILPILQQASRKGETITYTVKRKYKV